MMIKNEIDLRDFAMQEMAKNKLPSGYQQDNWSQR